MKTIILNIIKGRTKENPIYSSELEREFHVSGTIIRDIIRELRRDGYPICSNEDGYFWSEDPAIIHKTVVQLKSRLISLNETARAIEHTEYRYRMKALNQSELFGKSNTNKQ